MIRKDSRSIEQCYVNIISVLQSYIEMPDLKVVAKLPDRVMLQYIAYPVSKLSYSDKFRVWWFPGNHGTTAVTSYRENVPMYSLQLIYHTGGIWEADIDIFNPDYGLAPAAGHLIEVLWPGKTNPYRVRRGLLKRGIEVPLIT